MMSAQAEWIGRHDTRSRVERFLRERRRTALVVRGGPGNGKTMLLGTIADTERSGGGHVLTVAGVDAEAALPYAALHRLLDGMEDALDELPAPLRSAVHGAFGLAPETVPGNAFHVALAVLTLLTTPPRRTLLLVDDLQWLDRDTVAVLGFVARRADAEAVQLVIGSRPGEESPFGDDQEIDLPPLSGHESVRLLDQHWPRLGSVERRRVLKAAQGNPLALVEIPVALTQHDERISPVPEIHPEIPLTSRLSRAFSRNARALPPTTWALLIVAAANTSNSVGEVLRAGASVLKQPVDIDDLHPAVTLGLIEVAGREVRFRHPVTRSGLLRAASPPARRSAHRALAELLDDPDRRAWHFSEVVSADESVAVELEAAAERADQRGALEIALVFLERAVERSEDPRAEQRRAARGAEVAVDLNDRSAGERLLQRVSSDVVGWADGLRLLLTEEAWEPDSWSAVEVARIMAIADQAAESERPDIALRLLHPLVHSPLPSVRNPAVATTIGLIESHRDQPMSLLLSARESRHAPTVRRVVQDALQRTDLEPEITRIYATAATEAYDFAAAAAVLPRAAEALLARGQRASAGQALVSLAWSLLLRGDLDEAADAARRAELLGRETQQHFWTLGAVSVLAWLDGVRPDVADPGPRSAAARADLPAQSYTLLHEAIQLVVDGTAALAGQRYSESADVLSLLFAGDSFVRWWATAEYVEACGRAGRRDEARAVLEELTALVELTGSPFLTDHLAFGRAILASGGQEGDLVDQTLDRRPLDNPLLRARLCLWHGVQLRRRRQIRDARVRLERARDLFAGVGPTLWDLQVERELNATRNAPSQPAESTSRVAALTPQERQVALLAARGLTNRQIGEQLVLSPRTASTHLHRAFGKLGINRREELDPGELA